MRGRVVHVVSTGNKTTARSVHAFLAPYLVWRGGSYLVALNPFCRCSVLMPFLHSAYTAERAAEPLTCC
jgi:hypothetical protein